VATESLYGGAVMVAAGVGAGYLSFVADEPSEAPEVDDLVREAAREVDRTLIRWALSLSPLDRLRAAVSSAASLRALRDAKSNPR